MAMESIHSQREEEFPGNPRLPEDLQEELSASSGRRQFTSAVILGVLFYAAVVVLLGTNGYMDYKTLVETARNDGVTLASVVSEEVDQSMLLLDQVLAGMDAMLQTVEDDDPATIRKKISSYLTQRTEDIDFLMHLLSFGPNKEILHKSNTGAPPAELLSLLEQHWSQPGGGLNISAPLPVEPGANTWYFTVSEGVHGPGGSFMRIHAAAIDLHGFYSRFHELHLDSSYRITIASESGTIMYTIPKDESLIGRNLGIASGVFNQEGSVGSFLAESATAPSTSTVTAWAKVADAPILIIVEKPLDTVLEKWRINLYLVAGMCVALGMGLAVFLVVQARAQKRIAAFQRRLALQASTDPLTGALNRRFFIKQARKEAYRANRYDTPLTAVIFDLDHFKRINDTYGHDAGDEVLRQTADIAVSTLRETDLFCRYGGEEFAMVLPGADRDGAMAVAEKIRSLLEQTTITVSGDQLTITASFGLAVWSDDDTRIGLLLTRADEAMYTAKQRGRNRVAVWGEE